MLMLMMRVMTMLLLLRMRMRMRMPLVPLVLLVPLLLAPLVFVCSYRLLRECGLEWACGRFCFLRAASAGGGGGR